MTIRSDVATLITEALAGGPREDTKVVTSERELGQLDRSAVLVRGATLARTPGAPLSHRNVGLTVTIVSAHQDLDYAEDDLDELVPDILDALDHQSILTWTGARKVAYDDTHLAYDVDIDVITER